MGCGHSKINIYPRKSRAKNGSKKSVTPEKNESEEEEGLENETENQENGEDCDGRKTIKVKPFGGPILAQTTVSTSQEDFFKMLDEKIKNGPDYNSESESERAAEAARLSALLKDWETASAGSRSLPVTPKRRPKLPAATRSAEGAPRLPPDRNYVSQIPPSMIHESYGISQQISYRMNYPGPNYSQSPSHPIPTYPSALQYQAISPMYTSQPTYQAPPRHYPSYNQHGSPIKTYINSSPKHIPYDQPMVFSPSHKLYGPPVSAPKPMYTNGELLQQQLYNHQIPNIQHQLPNYHPQNHHPGNQIQYQYQEAREQVMAQHQPVAYRSRSYQSSVTIPIVVKNQQTDLNPLHRKQYELT